MAFDPSKIVWDDSPAPNTAPKFDPNKIQWDDAPSAPTRPSFDPSKIVWDEGAPNFSNVEGGSSTNGAGPAPGLGELIKRGVIEGGASLLRTIQGAGDNLDPGRALSQRYIESQLPEDARAEYRSQTHPLDQLAKSADEYAAPAPGEATPGLGGRVVQGAARLLPEIAGVVATGGESAVPEALAAAARAVPYAGRVLGGIVQGLPTAAKFTGVQSANLPEDMLPTDKALETAKAFGLNAAMAGLPVAVGKSLLTRVPTGAAIGYGQSAAMSALSGQQQDQAQNIIGGIQGAAFGAVPHEAPGAMPGVDATTIANQAAEAANQPPTAPTPTPAPAAPEPAQTAPAQSAPAPLGSDAVSQMAAARIAFLQTKGKLDGRDKFELGVLQKNLDNPSVLAETVGVHHEPDGADAEPQSAPVQAPDVQHPSLVDTYNARQSHIDAINQIRQDRGLSADQLNQLHDLRDQQDMHDPLTGLPNDKAFQRDIAAGSYDHVIGMDADKFKSINDTMGHGVGDMVLQSIAQRLGESAGSYMTFYRLHGDEYAGLARGEHPGEQMQQVQDALAREPITVSFRDKDGNTINRTLDGIGVSFGVGHDYETADAAAYENKRARGADQRRRADDQQSVGGLPPAGGGNPDAGGVGGRQAVPERASDLPTPGPQTQVEGEARIGEGQGESFGEGSQENVTAKTASPVELTTGPLNVDGRATGNPDVTNLDAARGAIGNHVESAVAGKRYNTSDGEVVALRKDVGRQLTRTAHDKATLAALRQLPELLQSATRDASGDLVAHAKVNGEPRAVRIETSIGDRIPRDVEHVERVSVEPTQSLDTAMADERSARVGGEEPLLASAGSAPESPHTVESLRDALSGSRLGTEFGSLEKSGALRLVDDPSNPRQGWWDGQSAVLNAAKLPSDAGYGTALHELTHRGVREPGSFREMVGGDEVARLNRRMDAIKQEGGRDADVVAAAERRIPESTAPEHHAEERLAYFIEEAADRQRAKTLPAQSATMFRQALARIKAYISNSRLGPWLERHGLKLGADDYVALAEASVRRQANAVRDPVSDSATVREPALSSMPAPEHLSDELKRVPDEITDSGSALRLGLRLGEAVNKLLPKVTPEQETMRNVVRSALAQRDRAVGTFDKATDAYLKYYDQRPRDVLTSPMKAMRDAIEFEKGRPISDPNARPFYAHMRQMLDAQAQQIRSFGKGYLDHLVTDYFPHLWKDEDQAAAFYGAAITRRPLGGRKEFTRERAVDSLEDGINAGMKPVTHNPAELVLMRYASGEKLLTQLRIMKELEDRGFVHQVQTGDRVPRGYAHVNDPAFGNRVVPDFIARDLNNYLDPGLTKYRTWRGFRWLENFMLTCNLGLSAFHAGMTTLDTIATHFDLGWRRLVLQGDLRGGLTELGKIPFAVVTSPIQGGRLVKQFYGERAADPNTAALLNMLTEGGAKGYMSPIDYNDAFTKMVRAWRQRDAAGMATQTLPGAIEATTRLISHKLVPAQKMIARVMHAKYKLDEVAGALGKQKGDYAGTIDAMNPEAVREMSREINATIDDRLGQFNYDAEFWNKTFRDMLHATVQSVGWNFGTLRLLIGGAKDAVVGAKNLATGGNEHYIGPLDKEGELDNFAKAKLTDRLSYLISLNAVVGLAGATLQYMLTGEAPKETKDFFFPRTGRKNNDGSDERLSFPSYVKDEFALATHPIVTASHKVHPIFGKMMELAANKDFYGTQIYDPDASMPSEAKDILSYLGKSFLPYAVTGAMKAHDNGENPVMAALPFVGITPAPGDIAKSAFNQYVTENYYAAKGGTRTQDQANQSHAHVEAIQAVREGREPDTSQLTPHQKTHLQREARSSLTEFRFSRLPVQQQVRAYELATPEERKEFDLGQALRKGLGRKLKALPPDQRTDVQQRIGAVDQAATAP